MSDNAGPIANSPFFEAVIERLAGNSIVRVSGEVDLASAPALAERVHEALLPLPSVLIIDLGAVTLLDSTGLGVLIETLNALDGAGNAAMLRLVVGEPQVAKVLAITGLDSLFAIFPTVEDALTAAT